MIGALTTYTDIRRSESAASISRRSSRPPRRSAPPRSRTAGRSGGNVVNASPAGDTLPVLLALDAAIVVGGPRGERTVPRRTSGRRIGGPRARRRADAPGPDPVRGRPREAIPQGRHAARPGDLQGRHGAGLAAGERGRRGATCGSPGLRGATGRSVAGRRGGTRRAASRPPHRRCRPRRRCGARSARSTTSARRPTTGGRWRLGHPSLRAVPIPTRRQLGNSVRSLPARAPPPPPPSASSATRAAR